MDHGPGLTRLRAWRPAPARESLDNIWINGGRYKETRWQCSVFDIRKFIDIH